MFNSYAVHHVRVLELRCVVELITRGEGLGS